MPLRVYPGRQIVLEPTSIMHASVRYQAPAPLTTFDKLYKFLMSTFQNVNKKYLSKRKSFKESFKYWKSLN